MTPTMEAIAQANLEQVIAKTHMYNEISVLVGRLTHIADLLTEEIVKQAKGRQ